MPKDARGSNTNIPLNVQLSFQGRKVGLLNEYISKWGLTSILRSGHWAAKGGGETETPCHQVPEGLNPTSKCRLEKPPSSPGSTHRMM